jgi:hypothetical protein
MIAKLRALRLLFAVLLVAGMIAVALTPQSAGAYYGEVEGYRSFNGGYGGSSTQGCNMELFVLYGKRVQPYCWMHNGATDAWVGFTNWHEYPCWNWEGCTYYVYIPTQGAPWHPHGCYHLKKDDYGGQHAIIMSCWPS